MTDEAKKIVLFDIDYTLFDTDLYREKYYPRLALALGFTLEEFKEISKAISTLVREQNGHFDPTLYLTHLFEKKKTDISFEEFEDLFWDTTMYGESLFKDIQRVFEKLSGQGFIIGILSTGNDRHQRQKIASIISHFTEEHIHIFTDKISNLSQVLEKYNNWRIYIVDDLPEVLVTAKKLNNEVYTIWVKSQKKQQTTDLINDFKPDRIIFTISELTTGLESG